LAKFAKHKDKIFCDKKTNTMLQNNADK
jgi:hypothetical protein